jgi:hypothetical protein
MARKVNLLRELAATAGHRPSLERVRLASDEVAVLLFTAEAEAVDLHFCREIEIPDYALCNGPGCLLCAIGRVKVERHLLPVYLMGAGTVAVLAVPTSLRPRALLPQLAPLLEGDGPRVVFIARERDDYHVSSIPLAADVDAGEAAIGAFLADHEAGRIALDSVYPRLENAEIARLPEIARMVKLKGIDIR